MVIALALTAMGVAADEIRTSSLWIPVDPEAGHEASAPHDEELVPFEPLLRIDLPPLPEGEPARWPSSHQVGIGRSIPKSLQGNIDDALIWLTARDGGRVANFEIASPDASALRVGLRATLPEGAIVRLLTASRDGAADRNGQQYGRDDFAFGPDNLLGRLGSGDGDLSRTWWSPIFDGDAVGVEVVLPSDAPVESLSLEVVAVSHFPEHPIYGPLPAGGTESCGPVDAMCSRVPSCELDAALRLTFTESGGNSYTCSATAINDDRLLEEKLAAPSVLTSHRCLSDPHHAENVIAHWHHRSTGCDTSTLTNRHRVLNSGADLLAGHAPSDHTLLRLRDPVPTDSNRCLAAWTTAEDILGTTSFAIHHGMSGLKEWAEGEVGEKTEYVEESQAITGYRVDVAQGAPHHASVGAGWFVEREDGPRYVGVHSDFGYSAGIDCGVASVGSFAAFFDAAGREHLGMSGVSDDDHGNAAEDATPVDVASGFGTADGTIGGDADVDVFRIVVPGPGVLTAYSRGSTDTVGLLLTVAGEEIARDDDGGFAGNFRLVADVDQNTYFLHVRGFEGTIGDYTVVVTFIEHPVQRTLTYSVPLFLPAGDPSREGFLRVVNRSDQAGIVDITAIDDAGRSRGPVALALKERETVHLTSRDLESGNAAKGLTSGVGDGDGNWRLRLASQLHLNPQAFVRTADGFVTSMHDLVGLAGESHRVVFFNPASNLNQRSVLRLTNPTAESVAVTITGRDDTGRGAPGGVVTLDLAAESSMSLTSRQLEEGTSATTGRLGDGTGKWELAVEADGGILAMSLLETPTGHLANVSTINAADQLPLFLAAGGEREGFLRVINSSNRPGTVRIAATDEAGVSFGPLEFDLGARAATHFNSTDLERGNTAKGLVGGLGDGAGSWRLAFSSDLDVTVQAYARTLDGFVTSMHEQVSLTGRIHDVAFFNPGSNVAQRSWLHLTNLESREVGVEIAGMDDAGDGGLTPVALSLPPNAVREISAAMLESGDAGLAGRLGNGVGKWQLAVSANGRIEVVNLLETPTGHLTNLSTIAAKPFERAYNDVFIQPGEVEMVSVDGVNVEAARNQILVFLDRDVTSEELRSVDAAITALGGRRLALSTRLRTIQVGIDDAVDEAAFTNAVAALAGVHVVGVNAVLAPDAVPLDQSVAGRAGGDSAARPEGADGSLHVVAQAAGAFEGGYWTGHINAEPAWEAMTGVTFYRSPVGIVDTGLRSPQGVVDESRLQRYTPTGAPGRGYFGTSAHGEDVIGFAAAEHDGDRRGVNPHSPVLLVDVERRGVVYESAVLGGIQTAIDSGAKVVNVSFGDGARCLDSRASRLAARERWRRKATNVMEFARQADALVVWSAGSDCEKGDDRYLPPIAATPSQVSTWESHAVVVGASTEHRLDACFSRMGDVVDLMAPGRGVAFGPGRPLLDGTSYAAPQVAGAAGLVRGIDNTLSAPETKVVLLGSASGTISVQSATANAAQCASRYTGGVTTANGPGEATSSEELLNVGAAVQSAILASSVPLVTKPTVTLSPGARARVPVEVQVPSTGVGSADIVFLIDQTGSFENDIATLRSSAASILKGIGARGIDVRFGIAGFGDYMAASEVETVFALHQDFTHDLDAAEKALDALSNLLVSRGDAAEAQYEALYRATNQFSWRVGALRVIFLATDAPFHDSDTAQDYPGTGREAALARLQEKDVVVIGLLSGDDARAKEQLGELALLTGGNVRELDTASTGINDAVELGLDEALGSVDLELEVIAGSAWVVGVTSFGRHGVSPGETVTFTVHLEGHLENSIDPLMRDVYAWAWADGSGLIGRTRIPVVVPSEPAWRLSAVP